VGIWGFLKIKGIVFKGIGEVKDFLRVGAFLFWKKE